MKALITGGAGFIGYHLANELLKYGYKVTIADNFARGVKDSYLKELESKSQVEVLSTDLLDRSILETLGQNYDYIYHLAAIIGVQNVLSRPDQVLRDNMLLLFNMLDFANRQQNLKRIVFASTSEIYAGTLNFFDMKIPTPEDTPLTILPLENPRTSYMLSKIYGEAVMYQSQLPFTIIRPHNFYGPRMGMSHVIPELLRKAYFNEGKGNLEVFSPNHKRTFCYISDAVALIRLLAECNDSLGKAFNIGNQEPEVSMRAVAGLIQKVVGSNYAIVEKPVTLGSPERRCPDMQKTHQYIQYINQISLEDGIKKTFQWYKENIFNGKENSAK